VCGCALYSGAGESTHVVHALAMGLHKLPLLVRVDLWWAA
jgi:hypothetical protein